MENANRPTHYGKPADALLRQRVEDYIRDEGLTNAEFAKRVGKSRSALSRYIGGTYQASAETMEASIRAYFKRVERAAEGGLFVQTRIAALVMEHLEFALASRALVVLGSLPGSGKSTAANEFVRRQLRAGNDAIAFVTANAVTSASSLLTAICAELGMKEHSALAFRIDAIIARLKSQPHLLIIDDAHYCSIKVLRALCTVYDLSGCGLALLGTRELLAKFEASSGRDYEDMSQMFSRVDLVEEVPDVISDSEAERIVQARCSWMTAADARQVAEVTRNPRSLVKLTGQIEYIRSNYERAGRALPGMSALLEVAEKRTFQVSIARQKKAAAAVAAEAPRAVAVAGGA